MKDGRGGRFWPTSDAAAHDGLSAPGKSCPEQAQSTTIDVRAIAPVVGAGSSSGAQGWKPKRRDSLPWRPMLKPNSAAPPAFARAGCGAAAAEVRARAERGHDDVIGKTVTIHDGFVVAAGESCAVRRPLRNPASLRAEPGCPFHHSIRAGFQRRYIRPTRPKWVDK
jgi:hypothetical protein